ncbi:MAG: pantoate--beta-alanine ligase [Deltaproteobacteria bacterium]|nr:pantoate--beta-alanine ligase [Deltaproteobacteria bacterium]
MRKLSRYWKTKGNIIGFVPTMGYLHEGHLSLVRAARKRCDKLVVSIFVNPTQFGPREDLEKYPRDLDKDLALCARESVDVVFHPGESEMYPGGFQTYVTVQDISKPMCGVSRPTHFRGVATIVAKLFNMVEPHFAVFGEKDFQQLLVIRKMVEDLDMDIEIVPHPIVREPDGLAMSSRNVYLSAQERRQAVCLSQALTAAQDIFSKGERDAETIKAIARKNIQAMPLAKIDYVELRNASDLSMVDKIDCPCVLALAVFFEKARLIDNCILDPGSGRYNK